MKKLTFLLLFAPLFIQAQQYIDILKVDYGTAFKSAFNDANSSTEINTLNIGLTLPVVLNNKHALITGVNFSMDRLQLFPNAKYTTLYSTTLKLGLSTTLSKTWSSKVILLPKIASNYKNITTKDLFMGGIVLFEKKKHKNLTYQFGAYASMEGFSLFVTPVFGIYYKNPNNGLIINALLPNAFDISFPVKKTRIGFDFSGIVRSFNLKKKNEPSLYIEKNPLEFSSYIQFNALPKKVLLRAKIGYTTNTYEVYADNEKVDLMLPLVGIGDDRTQLNPVMSGGLFIRLEAIYRFHY